jgi:hypothetical protein
MFVQMRLVLLLRSRRRLVGVTAQFGQFLFKFLAPSIRLGKVVSEGATCAADIACASTACFRWLCMAVSARCMKAGSAGCCAIAGVAMRARVMMTVFGILWFPKWNKHR